MYTYTTPTITCVLNGIDFSAVECVRIAIGNDKYDIVREVLPENIDNGRTTIKLTQEETASFGAGTVSIQARVVYLDETVQATNVVVKSFLDVIDKVVV